MPQPNAHLLAYADDTAIIAQSSEIVDATENLQIAINTLGKWFKTWNIALNPSKCIAKIFALKRIKNPPEITIDEETIRWNDLHEPVRYLGVFLDTRLTWKYHILQKVNQGYGKLKQLYPLINRRTSLKCENTVLIYKTLIRPLITYACAVWGNSAKTNLNKIQVLQNKLLRIAVDAEWYISNEQLHNELKMDSIVDHISTITTRFHERIQYTEVIQ